MNESFSFRVITVKDLWNLLIQRIVVIILVTVIVVSSIYIYDEVTYVPSYASTATLYILRENENMSSNSGEASNEFSLALKVVTDCNYILKSRAVVEQVIEELSMDESLSDEDKELFKNMRYEQLYSRISTYSPANSRILEVTVQLDKRELTKVIVDKLCEVGKDKIFDAMGFDQVNIFDYGVIPDVPYNRTSVYKYGITAGLTAIITYGVFLLMFLLDDRIRTDEDIERFLGLSVLAEIPNSNDQNKSRYGYYRRYGGSFGKYVAKEKRS